MRYGCCLNMVAKGEDKTGIEWIEKLAEMGFDYAELPLAEIMMLSEAEFKAFKRKSVNPELPAKCATTFSLLLCA